MDTHASKILEALTDFAQGPERLEAAIAGLSDRELDTALDGQGWTIRQYVHHLTDGIDLWKGFVKQAMGNPGCEFMLGWYFEIPQLEWGMKWSYAERAVEGSLALFRACHVHVIELLEHAPETWELTLRVKFPQCEEQSATIGEVVEMQTRHVKGHVEEILKIREHVH